MIAFALVAIIVSIRFIRMKNGVRVSKGRSIGYMVVLSAIAVIFVGESFLSVGIPPILIIPYIMTAAASAHFGYRHSKNALVFWKDSTGTIFVKGGMAVFVVYIAALLGRMAIGFLFVGPNFASFAPTDEMAFGNAHVSAAAYYAYVAADFLVMLGVGLFIGRNVRVFRHYTMIERGEASVPQV